jgi:hypothetical protein
MPVSTPAPKLAIASATVPANPSVGMTWFETINGSNLLVEKWNWVNDSWYSDVYQSQLYFANVAGNADIVFTFDSSKDIYFESINFHYYANSATTATNYYQAQFRVYSNGSEIIANPAKLPDINFLERAGSSTHQLKKVIDKLYTTANNFRIFFNRIGGGTIRASLGASIYYRYKRK